MAAGSGGGNLSEWLSDLTAVKKGDKFEDVANHKRINSIQNLLRALVRGDNIISGMNVRKKSQNGWVILSSNAGGDGFPNVTTTPWLVTISADEDGDATFIVNPGSIMGVKATGNGIDDAPPPPENTGHSVDDGDPYSIYAKVTIGSDPINNYRTKVTAVKVVTDNEEGAVDVGSLDPYELNVKWADPTTKLTGYFYIKIADIAAVRQGLVFPKIAVTSLTQVLDSNILSLVIVGDEVVTLF